MHSHSFVILAHKDSEYLEICIKSLLKQTVKSNIKLVTSNPSDYLEGICLKYKIIYCVNITSTGAVDNWNYALKTSDSTYTTLAHYDDVYHSNYVEKILEGNKDFLIAFSNYDEINADGVLQFSGIKWIKLCLLLPFYFKKSIKNLFVKKLTVSFGNPICCPSVTYNMNLLSLAAFKFDAAFPHNLDWVAWVWMAKHPGAFKYCRKKLVAYRIHDSSVSSIGLQNKSKNIRAEEDLRMFQLRFGRIFGSLLSKLYSLSYYLNKR